MVDEVGEILGRGVEISWTGAGVCRVECVFLKRSFLFSGNRDGEKKYDFFFWEVN